MTDFERMNYENVEVIQMHDFSGRRTQKLYYDYVNHTYEIVNDNPRYDYYEGTNEDYE